MLKKLLLYGFAVCGIIFILLIGALLYIAKPWIEFYESRLSNKPVCKVIEYVNVTCSDTCTKFYLVQNEKIIKIPIFLYVMKDMENPNNSLEMVHGERISVTGFEYVHIYKNLITGKMNERTGYRFDVISWKRNGKVHSSRLDAHNPGNYVEENYTDCLDCF